MSHFDGFQALVRKARDLEAEFDRNLLLQGAVALLALLYVTNSPPAGELADTLRIELPLIQIGVPVASAILFFRMWHVLSGYLGLQRVLTTERWRVTREGTLDSTVLKTLEAGVSPISLLLHPPPKMKSRPIDRPPDSSEYRPQETSDQLPESDLAPWLMYGTTFLLVTAPVFVNTTLSIYFVYTIPTGFVFNGVVWGVLFSVGLAMGFVAIFYLAFGAAAAAKVLNEKIEILASLDAKLSVRLMIGVTITVTIGLMILWDPLPPEVTAEPDSQTATITPMPTVDGMPTTPMPTVDGMPSTATPTARTVTPSITPTPTARTVTPSITPDATDTATPAISETPPVVATTPPPTCEPGGDRKICITLRTPTELPHMGGGP